MASALLTHPLAFHYQEVQTHINTYSKTLDELEQASYPPELCSLRNRLAG